MTTATAGPTIRLEHASRAYGAVRAVDDATVEFVPGRIHALIGENGAGKSTLLKMAAGAIAPTAGRVLVGGAALEPATTAEAIRRGVGLVYQHFMLCGAFRAIENLVLGQEPIAGFGGQLDERAARRRAEATMAEAGFEVPLDAVTDTLTVGERQRLEILRVLFRGARAVLLDEPTAVLSPLEADDLYATLRRLADGGATIAVVTHRLDEVQRHADHVTVMRHGAVVLDLPSASANEDALTSAIMGGDPPPPFARPKPEDAAEVRLRARGLSVAGALHDLDLEIRAGEIVGVAGVEGNGQRELVRALAGLAPATGDVEIGGRALAGLGVAARRAVLGVVHEDRHADGLMLDAPVGDNLVLGEIGAGFDEAAAITKRIAQFGIEPSDPGRLAAELSGGNQQKIVVARPLARATRGALVLAQPTRGVDVGAAAAIHAAIGEAAAAGLAVLVVSADLSELKKLAHRIVVLHRGRLVATFAPDAEDAAIGRAMLGSPGVSAAATRPALRWASAPLRAPWLVTLLGVLLVWNLLSFAYGMAPLETMRLAVAGSWGTPYGVGQVLFKATPILLTGLAFEVAMRAGLFNIGAEGQLALAALVSGVVAHRLPAGTPAVLALPIVLVVAAVTGALVALPPALMRARLGVHEIIGTIMMNRIVEGVVPFAFVAVLGLTGLKTEPAVAGALLPKLDRLVPALSGSAASVAFPLAIGIAFGVDAWLRRAKAGREICWIGKNAAACRAEGVPVASRLVLAMLISGALAGLVVTATVLGYKGYDELGLGAGAGFTGIAVALLGRGRPVGLTLAALLLGTLEQAGLAINAFVPKEAMSVLEACVIVLMAAGERLAAREAATR